MQLIDGLKKCRLIVNQLLSNWIKRAQLVPLGFRAEASTAIAWSVSADGGGKGGRILVGKHTLLDRGVILRAYGNTISIGDNSSLHAYCVVQGGGAVKIGNGVRIATHTVIIASNHIIDDPSKLIYLQGESTIGVIIEDDVWIGAGAKILDGVTVRRGSVVGAGAVVTRSTEPYSVVVGNPARVLRFRKQSTLV